MHAFDSFSLCVEKAIKDVVESGLWNLLQKKISYFFRIVVSGMR